MAMQWQGNSTAQRRDTNKGGRRQSMARNGFLSSYFGILLGYFRNCELEKKKKNDISPYQTDALKKRRF